MLADNISKKKGGEIMTLKPTLLAAAKEKQSVMAGACIETVCWAYCSTHGGDPGCCWMWGHFAWV